MKNLYKEFFYIPKHQKIRDKVMITRAIMVVIFIVMCLMAMSFTAYAHFTFNVSSISNSIESASFEADVSINNGEPTTTKSGEIQTIDLPAGEYQIVIKKSDCSAQTGFCIITINNTHYYTSQIGVDVNKNLTDASVEFTLKVSADTKMEILSHWGTSSCYGYNDTDSNALYIKNGDDIDLTVSSTNDEETPSNEEAKTTESEENTSPPTTPITEILTSSEEVSSESTLTSEQSSEIEPSSVQESSTTEGTEVTSSSENTEATSTDISLTSE